MKVILSTMLQRLLQGPEDIKDKIYSLSEVADHCHCNDCWVIIGDHVYDITSFLDQHPGGLDVLMEQAGRDATVAFYSSGHHPSTIDLLKPFCVGILAPQERVNLIGTGTSRDTVQTVCS